MRAVADGTRLFLLREIGKRGGICACKLPPLAKVSQPAVSQHLSVLNAAGLVEMRKDGAKRVYSASPKGKKVLLDISRW